MKTVIRSLFLTLCLVGFTACASSSNREWAKTALKQRMHDNALIVDVRSPDEYKAGHIKGAINVPHRQVQDRLSEFGSDSAAPIVVYCGKGGRAEYARKVLTENGYNNVWNLGSYSDLAEPGLVTGGDSVY